MENFLMIVQRKGTLEVFLARFAEKPMFVVVTFQMLVQQIFPRERFLAVHAREFVRVHVDRAVPG